MKPKLPDSIVIVKNENGWVAHLRYTNPFENCDLAEVYRETLFLKIERKLNPNYSYRSRY